MKQVRRDNNAIRDKTPQNEHRYQLGVNYLALKGKASESILFGE